MRPSETPYRALAVAAGLALSLAALPATAVSPVQAAPGDPVAEDVDVPLKNWTAPPFWSATPGQEAEQRAGDGPAIDAGGSLPSPNNAAAPAAYVAITPCRLADTRGTTGTFGGPAFTAQQTRTFPIPGGPCAGLPATAVAWSLNVTAVPTVDTVKGYVTVWPTGQARPSASNLNAWAGQVVANTVIVAAGTGGAVDVFSWGAVNLVIDINGYYIAGGIVNSVNSVSGALGFFGSNGMVVAPSGGGTISVAGPIPGPGLVLLSSALSSTLTVSFGGNGSAASASRSDHTHFGQTWSGGSQFALELLGSNSGGTWLNLSNSSGNWWNLISTGTGNGEGAGKFLIRDGNQVAVQISPGGIVDVKGQLNAPNLPRFKSWSQFLSPSYMLDGSSYVVLPSTQYPISLNIPGPGTLVFTVHGEVGAAHLWAELVLEDYTNGDPATEILNVAVMENASASNPPYGRHSIDATQVVAVTGGAETRTYLVKFNNRLASGYGVDIYSASLDVVWFPAAQQM